MTEEEVVDNLGTIARSGTAGFVEKLKNAEDADAPDLIGQFRGGLLLQLHGGRRGHRAHPQRRARRPHRALAQQGRGHLRGGAARGRRGPPAPRHLGHPARARRRLGRLRRRQQAQRHRAQALQLPALAHPCCGRQGQPSHRPVGRASQPGERRRGQPVLQVHRHRLARPRPPHPRLGGLPHPVQRPALRALRSPVRSVRPLRPPRAPALRASGAHHRARPRPAARVAAVPTRCGRLRRHQAQRVPGDGAEDPGGTENPQGPGKQGAAGAEEARQGRRQRDLRRPVAQLRHLPEGRPLPRPRRLRRQAASPAPVQRRVPRRRRRPHQPRAISQRQAPRPGHHLVHRRPHPRGLPCQPAPRGLPQEGLGRAAPHRAGRRVLHPGAHRVRRGAHQEHHPRRDRPGRRRRHREGRRHRPRTLAQRSAGRSGQRRAQQWSPHRLSRRPW